MTATKTTDIGLIRTLGSDGQPNGYVIPLWHADSGERVDQVYLTTLDEGSMKGPHLHKIRAGRFTCVKGHVLIVTREPDGRYVETWCGEVYASKIVCVPPGTPAAIYNVGAGPAYVLNMPTPPWRASEPDEHDVPDWSYRLAHATA